MEYSIDKVKENFSEYFMAAREILVSNGEETPTTAQIVNEMINKLQEHSENDPTTEISNKDNSKES